MFYYNVSNLVPLPSYIHISYLYPNSIAAACFSKTLFFSWFVQVDLTSINLLIEKPLGLNIKEAKFLTNLAKKKKLVLKTGFNLRFDDGIKAVKKILQNKINDIYFIKISYVNGTVKTNKNNLQIYINTKFR